MGDKWRLFACRLWVIVFCVVVTGSLAPGDSSLMRMVGERHINDKVEHFTAYALLAVLPVVGLRRRTIALLGAGSMALTGLILELLQHFVPGRTPDVLDELANISGVVCGMAFGSLIHQTLVSGRLTEGHGGGSSGLS